MSTLPKPFLTPEQYLEIERAAQEKSEYYQGEMFAMSGASFRHGRVASQLHFLLKLHLRHKPCDVNTSDLMVYVPLSGLYCYPDLSVVCEAQFVDPKFDTLTNPIILAEILSPSTERYDRIFKAHAYRAIPTLRECLLIAQDQAHVELHRKQDGDNWCVLESRGKAATVELSSIDYTLHLAELYETALPAD